MNLDPLPSSPPPSGTPNEQYFAVMSKKINRYHHENKHDHHITTRMMCTLTRWCARWQYMLCIQAMLKQLRYQWCFWPTSTLICYAPVVQIQTAKNRQHGTLIMNSSTSGFRSCCTKCSIHWQYMLPLFALNTTNTGTAVTPFKKEVTTTCSAYVHVFFQSKHVASTLMPMLLAYHQANKRAQTCPYFVAPSVLQTTGILRYSRGDMSQQPMWACPSLLTDFSPRYVNMLCTLTTVFVQTNYFAYTREPMVCWFHHCSSGTLYFTDHSNSSLYRKIAFQYDLVHYSSTTTSVLLQYDNVLL